MYVFVVCVLYVCAVCVVCVCVCDIFVIHPLYVSYENILRVNATKYFEVDGHKVQRNPNLVVLVQETIAYVLNLYTDGDVYLIHFQTFLLSLFLG